jgi:excisionase family DNA binding protein
VVPTKRLLSLSEAAETLGVSKSQLYVLIRRGEVRAMRLGKVLRVPTEAIDQLVADGMRRPDDHPDGTLPTAGSGDATRG